MSSFIAALLGAFAPVFVIIGCAFFLLVLPVVLAVMATQFVRTGKCPVALTPAVVSWVGFWLGGLGSWALISPRWSMPFWQTLAASVDAETYGHPLEHQAENILVWVLFAAVLTALMSWATVWLAGRVRLHYR
jgi:hypothetical protein